MGLIEKIGYRNADLIVGTMPRLQKHVEKVTGVPKDVKCIPMGIDDAFIEGTDPHKLTKHSTFIEKDKFIVCHAGSIGTDNALETLFETAKHLQDFTDIEFWIIGEGDLKTHYQQTYGYLANLRFHDRVSRSKLAELLQSCDVLYFAAHKNRVFDYGQSLNKIIDYMAAGKPIIGSYSGYPSMVNEAECGVFVPSENSETLKNAILAMQKMPKPELDAMGTAGREWLLSNRRYETLGLEYIKIINNMIDPQS